MPKIPAVFNWSGGNDSMLALHKILKAQKFDVKYLLTSMNESFNSVSMHGVREVLLLKQVDALNIPLVQLRLPEMPDVETYEQVLSLQMNKFKAEGIHHSIFGDIFLADLKVYRENQLAKLGMEAVFPLWKQDSLALVKEFIDLGYQTIVVCAQDGLQDFCGRIIDQSFLDDLPLHIDPCGENGEFHTFVFDGPLFGKPIDFIFGDKVFRNFPNSGSAELPVGYWYINLLP